MRLSSLFLSLICLLMQIDWISALSDNQIRSTRYARYSMRNGTKGISSISSTVMPENSTDLFSSTPKENEWDYNKKSLTAVKVIFISVFATILIIMLVVTVAWNWKAGKQRPTTMQTQEVMTQPEPPNPEAAKTERI